MTPFDSTDKANKPLLDYLKEKTFLICDASTIRQSTIQTILINQFQVKTSKIKTIASIKRAQTLISHEKYNFVFVDLNMNEQSGLELLEPHLQSIPNRLAGGFFILSDENSPANATIILNYELDAFIPIPSSIDNILEILINSLKPKAAPSVYAKKLSKAKEHYFLNNYDDAYNEFTLAKDFTNKPDAVFVGMGLIHLKRGEMEEAKEAFKKGIEIDKKNYQCLSKLFEIYLNEKNFIEAYQMVKSLAKFFPIHPERFPDIIRVCIATSEFGDVFKLSKMFMDYETKDRDVRIYLAAGLVLCGKYLLAHSKKFQAKEALSRAIHLAPGKVEIVKNIVTSLLDIEEDEYAKEIVTKCSPNTNFDLMYYTIKRDSLNDEEKISLGKALIDAGIIRDFIYKDIVLAMKSAEKPIEEIKEMSAIAIKAFPKLDDQL